MRSSNKTKYTLTVGFTASVWSPWYEAQRSDAMRLGAMMAVDRINNSTSLMRDASIQLAVAEADMNWGKSAVSVIDLNKAGNLALIIGDVTSAMNIHSAAVSSYYGFLGSQIPHVCILCADASLSDSANYGTFFRMMSMGVPRELIAVAYHMGWRHISILYTVDAMSLSSLNMALEAAGTYNMTILTTQAIQFSPSVNTSNGPEVIATLSPVYEILKNLQTRIIVLISSILTTDDIYFSAAYCGLAGPGYVWITFNTIGMIPIDQIIEKYGAAAWQTAMHNIILPNYSPVSVRSNDQQSQEYDIVLSHYDFYVQYKTGFGTTAYGDYYANNNTNVPFMNVLSAYDATMAILLTWDRILNETGFEANAIYNGSLTGSCSPQAVTDTKYVGCLDLIAFDADHNLVAGIQWYQNASGYQIINSVFSNGVIPSDSPNYTLDQLLYGDPMATFILVIYTVALAAVAASMLVILRNPGHPSIKPRSPLFNTILMIGEIQFLVSGLLEMLHPSPLTCVAQPWLLSIGLCMMLSGILVKTYRIWRIFDNKKFKERVIPDSLLLNATFAITSTMVILLIGWTVANPVSVSVVHTLQTEYISCSYLSSDNVFWWSTSPIITANGLLLLATAILAHKTRSVPTQYGESLHMGIAVYNALICTMLCIAQIYSSNNLVRTKTITRLIIQLVGVAVFHSVMVAPVIKSFLASKLDKAASNDSRFKESGVNQIEPSVPTYESEKGGSLIHTFCWKKESQIFSRWSPIRISYIRGRDSCLVFTEPGPPKLGISVPVSLVFSIERLEKEPSCFRIAWPDESYLIETGDEKLASQWILLVNSDIVQLGGTAASPVRMKTIGGAV
ncbi:7 transmembrane sweet-taste receptor of 3 GCPR-domain-containing protein [Polychytrium aggregatum]|uniref:7 transmembrane sweet-taste receptor of 3 GCPR-domain-containing protein n=1 Tax=Polychytrium aggregatum TaxID=110093 RepID=UPI0022FE51EF|nr:7 transmembrane sweet-taste receptor of 3 GCPR-domain-containing protein [Polychytrium aggregatum]KAI9209175.1 7 transmembrane sweet-taste receptor of 3 GCPR-domain-containing protein [Polychytrium aggregatum]